MNDKTNLRIETVNEYCIVDKDNQIVKDEFCSEEEAAKWLEDIYGIKHEPKPQSKIVGWIPCSERLPDTRNNILICQCDGYVSVGYYSQEKFLDLNSYPFDNVIAWQPLPEAYHG